MIVAYKKEKKMILNQGVRILNEVLNMNSSPDDRYIYCVTEKSIKVYDSKEKEIIQELKKLGNAKTAISVSYTHLTLPTT